MAITYPPDCDTPAKRTEWLCRAQELLRFVHNIFSYWFHNEITQKQYDNPPLPPEVDEQAEGLVRAVFTKLKNKYPYKLQLAQEDWDRFYREDFRPRSDKICTQINIQRSQLKQSTNWPIDIGDI